MLRKNIKTDGPVAITVGAVRFHIVRIGERVVSLAVDAPRDMPIEFTADTGKSADSCEGGARCGTDGVDTLP